MFAASVDYRQRRTMVTLKMPLVEFRDMVELLEMVDPHGDATQELRKWLDKFESSLGASQAIRERIGHDARRQRLLNSVY